MRLSRLLVIDPSARRAALHHVRRRLADVAREHGNDTAMRSLSPAAACNHNWPCRGGMRRAASRHSARAEVLRDDGPSPDTWRELMAVAAPPLLKSADFVVPCLTSFDTTGAVSIRPRNLRSRYPCASCAPCAAVEALQRKPICRKLNVAT